MPFLRHLASRIVRSLLYICKKVVRAKRKASNYTVHIRRFYLYLQLLFLSFYRWYSRRLSMPFYFLIYVKW